MADFIAVIRRAVGGLTNNTPEMRAKVYDKARSAVLRQLENMTPRPPEEMLRRQLDKLETAILEVEAEHAEALPPAEEEIAVEESYAAEHEPQALQAEPESAEPVAEEAPAAETGEPVAASYTDEAEEYPAEPEPEPETYETAPVEPHQEPVAEVYPESVAEASEEEPAAEDAYEPPVAAEETYEQEPPVDAERYAAADYSEEYEAEPVAPLAAEAEPEVAEAESWAEEPVQPQPADAHGFEPADETAEPTYEEVEPAWHEPERHDQPLAASQVHELQWTPEAPATGYESTATWPSFEPAVPQKSDEQPAEGIEFDADAAHEEFDASHRGEGGESRHVEMPAAIDLLDWDPATHTDTQTSSAAFGADSFDDWLGEEKAEPLAPAAPGKDVSAAQVAAAAAPVAASPLESGGDIDEFPASAETKAYRFEPKPKRNYAPLVLSLLGLLLLGGGGYLVWVNKGAMNEFVSGLVSSAPQVATEDTQGETAAPDAAGETPAAEGTTPPTETASAETAPVEDGTVSGQKFTQRLRPDGTEVDEGEASPAGTAGEGRSISAQNIASSDSAPVSGTAAAGAGAQSAAAPAAATATDAAIGGEKALLYEERLGQAAPTAITGRIEWTALQEKGETALPEPTIQGKLVVPDSGMTALITFKRNPDNSLPASHLIEIVFSVPPNFEGGAIENVQRVSMKRNEQDRGDPLVAVAAKITDDTFLIALNDFQDVVARNTDLLRTRSWIDIPVTYRNGRRALLTLEKGASGDAVFDRVLKEWAAIGNASGG